MNTDDYAARREQLICEDRALRLDSQDNGIAFSKDELAADRIVRSIRAKEAVSVWGPDSNASHDDDTHLFPGMAFLTARDIIVRTELFKIMSKMPKGALLHAHLDATVNTEVLLRLALQQPAIHVRAACPLLSPSILHSLGPQFCALPPEDWTTIPSLSDPSYVPGSWVPIQTARQNFSSALGGTEGFDKWVVSALTISPAEAYKTHNTTTKIWQKFQSTFLVARNLISYLPIWSQYIREFFVSSIEDGISYVEVRINFLDKTMVSKNGEPNIPHSLWLAEYNRILGEVKEQVRIQSNGTRFFDSKVIYSTIRFLTSKELEWYLDDCIDLKREYPHLIAGFDLVGHEDNLRPLLDYLDPLTQFVENQKRLGLDIPFIFHAGETLGDGTAADMNLYDAILLGTKRIGHGFSLIKHPKLMEICKQKKIAVETCPISNEILRLTSSMPMHPLPALINHGVPVTLCSDDPAVFGNMGLSFDFFQVLVASETSGLNTMKCLARDSFKYSSLSEEDQKLATAAWDRQWNEFVQWILSSDFAHQ